MPAGASIHDSYEVSFVKRDLVATCIFFTHSINPLCLAVTASGTVEGMSATGLGDGAGVKSRSPRKRVREAQDLRPAPSPKHNRACHLAAIGPAPRPAGRPRSMSQPWRHAASCHINSYPVAVRGGCTRNPHTRGSGLGNRDHSLPAACLAPVVDAVPCPGLRQADQARPNLAISVTSCGDVPPCLARPAPAPAWRQSHYPFSTAPSGTTPCCT